MCTRYISSEGKVRFKSLLGEQFFFCARVCMCVFDVVLESPMCSLWWNDLPAFEVSESRNFLLFFFEGGGCFGVGHTTSMNEALTRSFCWLCRPKIPSYVVNLDLPPAERWNSVAKAKSAEVIFLNSNDKNNPLQCITYLSVWMIDQTKTTSSALPDCQPAGKIQEFLSQLWQTSWMDSQACRQQHHGL